MKLREKRRENSRVHRRYDLAQTPFQRLRSYNVLSSYMTEKINSIQQAIDPVRLLKQIGTLQDALWRHAVLPPTTKNADYANNPQVCFKGIFESSAENKNSSPNMHDVFEPKTRTKRKYRKAKKTRIPHWCRNRPDPFELVNDEICAALEQNLEQTSKSILQYSQTLSRGIFGWPTPNFAAPREGLESASSHRI